MTTLEQSNDELLQGFLDEAVHALRSLPDQLAQYRAQPTDDAPLHAVFRAVHSIKGNAGFFGLGSIKKFAHALENTLDEVRNGQLELTDPLTHALIEGCDLLDEMLHLVLDGLSPDSLADRERAVLAEVETAAAGGRANFDRKEPRIRELQRIAAEIAAANLPQSAGWVARIQRLLPVGAVIESASGPAESLAESASQRGADAKRSTPLPAHAIAMTFAAGARDISSLVRALCQPFAALDAAEMPRDTARQFIAQASALAGDLETHGEPNAAGRMRDAAEQMRTIVGSPLDLDANLMEIVWDALWAAIDPLRSTAAAAAVAQAETTTVANAPDARKSEAAPADPTSSTAAAAAKGRFVRVREEHLDAFIGDVSNLFITCERIKDLQARMAAERVMMPLVDELKQVGTTFVAQTNALQHSVVALRSVPAQMLFGKFPRMARSLASQLGKQLDVVVSGEELGIDKALVEDLDAPLTHIIRNVCDHGIEPPAERTAQGKSAAGKLSLSCELTASHVVIAISDDGRGIDPERLRRKAVEKQLMDANHAAALSDQEAVELIFHPGFSTAEQITDVSGRGVGLDVVRTTLREHDGDVSVRSQVGQGTSFRLTIPIRQAVLVVDGLLVRDGDSNYVLPLEHIREIVELRPEQLKSVHGSQVAVIRGEPLAAVPLGELLGLPPATMPVQWHGIVIRAKTGALCVLTERIVGQRKVVINSLRDLLPGVNNIAGVAQMGGGRLALVLSAPDIIAAASRRHA